MAVVIPQDATFDVRRSFEQVNDELRDLKGENARLLEQLNVREGDTEKVRRDFEASQNIVPVLDFNDVFRASGPAHALGYVPDPTAEGPRPEGFERHLRDDAKFRASIAPFMMPDERHQVVNLQGHTHVAGSLMASKITATCGMDVVGGPITFNSGPGKVMTHGIMLQNTVTFVVADTFMTRQIETTGVITAAYAYILAGTSISAQINIGGSDIISSDVTVSSLGSWVDLGVDQNLSVSPGDDVRFDVNTVTGDVTDVAIYFVLDVVS